VADTHVPQYVLPEPLLDQLQGCDLILHAGDLCTLGIIRELERIAPVVAVHGNCDDESVLSELPEERRIDCEGIPLLLLHGHRGRTAVVAARTAAGRSGVRCIVFGHSHMAHNEWFNDVLLFNPGSPTWSRFNHGRSFGLITIYGQLNATIVPLGDT